MTTVEQALRILGDAKAFQGTDVGFAHGCIALLRIGQPLGAEKRARAHRMLARYDVALNAAGIPYAQVAPPDGSVPEPEPVAPILPAEAMRTRITVDQKRNRIVVVAPYALRHLTTSIVGIRYAGGKTGFFVGAVSPTLAERLLNAYAPTGVDRDEAVGELLAQAHRIKESAVHKAATDLPPIPLSKTDAWLHQRQAFWFAKEMPAVMLDAAMGTGKSKIITDLIVNSGAAASLVVCPERVIGVWPKQFLIHGGVEVHVVDPRRQNRNGEWTLVPIKDRVALYDQSLHECRCGLPHVVLTNYAASAHEPFKSWSIKQRWDYVVYDEAHRLKSAQGVWSKWALKMVRVSERRLAGTGTLMPQGPLDVFGQVRALDPGIFGTSETVFRRRYAILGGYENREIKGYQNEDELADRVASITYRVGAEVLDLPAEVPDVTLTTRLEPSAMRIYREVEEEMYAEVLADVASGATVLDAISAPNVLVKLLRLQQITGGAVKLDSGETLEISTAKEKLLADDLEDLPDREPVVVFARFRHDLDVVERVAANLGRPYAELSGRRSDALAGDATLADGVVLAGVQLQAGGTGVDFTRACYGIYYSLGYSLGDYLQSRARLSRPGQKRAVRFRHLIVEGTIDEEVYAALEARQSVTERIGQLIRERQEARVR